LVQIAVNHVRSEHRRGRSLADITLSQDADAEQLRSSGRAYSDSSLGDTPSQILNRREEWTLLELAIAELDEDDRVLLVNHHLLGQTYNSLAREFDVTPKTIRKRIHLVLSRLARRFEDDH
jgi:RNA polymerase sigma factor (sigma-70 family)